jgi:Uma2 family endonuclease
MTAAQAELVPHRFSREEYYRLAISLDPNLRWELLDGTIYSMTQPNPPHSGVVTYLTNRFRELGPKFLIRVQDPLEIERDGSPSPDIVIVPFRSDYYALSHPTGADAQLVIEIRDTEEAPRKKMRAYMNDGRIEVAWRIDIPGRFAERWRLGMEGEFEMLRDKKTLTFQNVTISVDDIFAILGPKA